MQTASSYSNNSAEQSIKQSIEPVLTLHNQLGEGPIWHPSEQQLYWVDILAKQVHCFNPETGSDRVWQLDDLCSFVIPGVDQSMYVGHPQGIFKYDTEFKTRLFIADPEPHLPQNRLNDAQVASNGLLYFGTMDLWESNQSGSFWGLFPSGEMIRLTSGITITNGPAQNAEGTVLYLTDTVARTIYRAPIKTSGRLGEPQVFRTFSLNEGYPDGMAVDSLGRLWCCHWGAGQISCSDANGYVVQRISLPVTNPTKLAFGGDDLSTLYITSARKGLSEEHLSAHPMEGSLLKIEVDIPGLASTLFDYRG